MVHPLHLLAMSIGAREALARLNGGLAGLCSVSAHCDPLLDPHLYKLRGVPGIHAALHYASLLLERFGRELEIIYMDVGSRRSPARPGNLFLLKHAESLYAYRNGRLVVVHRHDSRPPLGPLLLLSSPPGRLERVRQAARYILEIARVYALLSEHTETPRLVVKHGPLVEMIAVYLNPVFNAEERVYRQVLLHAGLDNKTVDDILATGAVGDSVNPGLLALELLRRIAEVVSRRRERIAVGVTEDTSVSRHLTAQLIYESLLAAMSLEPASPSRALEEFHGEGLRLLDENLQASKCMSDVPPLDPVELNDLVGRIQRRLAASASLATVTSGLEAWRLAASVQQELSREEVVDADLVLTAVYLTGSWGTSVYVYDPLLALARAAAELRLGGDEYRRVAETLDKLVHLEQYVEPGAAPSCARLQELVERLHLATTPDTLARLAYVPLPLRVDTIALRDDSAVSEAHDKLVEASGLVALAASTTLYKLPPGLIEADVRSRVSLNEALILAEVSRRLAGRLKPYAVILRHWPRRAATL